MEIKQYLTWAKITRNEFAETLGVTPIRISTAANGSRLVSLDLMIRMMKASDWRITSQGLMAPYLRRRFPKKFPTDENLSASNPTGNSPN